MVQPWQSHVKYLLKDERPRGFSGRKEPHHSDRHRSHLNVREQQRNCSYSLCLIVPWLLPTFQGSLGAHPWTSRGNHPCLERTYKGCDIFNLYHVGHGWYNCRHDQPGVKLDMRRRRAKVSPSHGIHLTFLVINCCIIYYKSTFID